MKNAIPGRSNLVAYEVAVDLIRALRPLLPALRQNDRNLTSQLQRAATSVVLNLAEGRGRLGRDRVHSFSIAAGSCHEVRAALQAAPLATVWAVVLVAPATVPSALPARTSIFPK